MSTPLVKDFFNNKVTIRLKNGHRFEGLLSQINYKNQAVILEDVEDLGNQTDKNFIPLDKKIVQKVFESENIEQILFKDKHFSEPKKYIKKDFWDATTEPVAQQPKYKQKTYGDKNQKPYYKKNYQDRDNRGGEYRGGDNNRGGDNRRNYNKGQSNYRNNGNNGERNNDYRRREQEPRQNRQEENDRDFR